MGQLELAVAMRRDVRTVGVSSGALIGTAVPPPASDYEEIRKKMENWSNKAIGIILNQKPEFLESQRHRRHGKWQEVVKFRAAVFPTEPERCYWEWGKAVESVLILTRQKVKKMLDFAEICAWICIALEYVGSAPFGHEMGWSR